MFGISKLAKRITLTIALVAAMSFNAFAAGVSVGTVNASGLRMREQASTDSKTLVTLSAGAKVVVLGKEGDWYKASYGSTTGYMYAQYLSVSSDESADLGVGVVTGSVVNVRSAPETGDVICQLSSGVKADIIGTQGGWYKVKYNSKEGFISPDYFEPSEETLSSRSGSAVEASAAVSGNSGSDLVAYAKNYLGVKYVYGGSTPKGFDCSGFTVYVFKHFGISLSRSASAQFKQGVSVSKGDLQPGDLVFFSQGSKSIGHVGIYVGGGSFIHASSPGDVVKITSLSESYYKARYKGARRFIG
jgi:cell wall-associated NlpC family hydrolase